MQSSILSEKRGGHQYEKDHSSDCELGCGCYMTMYSSGGPDGIDPFGKCPNNPRNKKVKASKEKKLKLAVLDDMQLVLQFQVATRKAWEVFLKHPQEIAKKSAEHREEQRVKRELMRRLRQKDKNEEPLVHNESQREARLRMGF